MSLTPEQIQENFQKFRSYFEKLGERSQPALRLVDSLGVRLATCPASSRKEYHAAFEGGLVMHSLTVLTNTVKLCKTFGWNIPQESIIIGALLHDIGKCGSDVADLYLPQTDSWRRDKLGEVYIHNHDIQYMTVPDRGLWLCQRFGLTLTEDESLAILLNDGHFDETNAKYKMKEPQLAIAVHMADLIATRDEKSAESKSSS